tara:strand:- start:61 stop:273 length:213 start_codon:yes stop_codon:yes gene_type:complete
MGQSFVFVNSVDEVNQVAATMKQEGQAVISLNARLEADVRKQVFEDFSNNKVKVSALFIELVFCRSFCRG